MTAAEQAALPLLSGSEVERALYPALDVADPPAAALAALRLAERLGAGARASDRIRAVEAAVSRAAR